MFPSYFGQSWDKKELGDSNEGAAGLNYLFPL